VIPPSLLDAVLARVAAAPVSSYGALAQALRAEFAGTHITVCGEDDVSPRLPPAIENGACCLYYVDAHDHCLKLTTDAEAATGIAVALRGDDD
jgi:hypothetical protein